jgi:hypothetical protein
VKLELPPMRMVGLAGPLAYFRWQSSDQKGGTEMFQIVFAPPAAS